MPERPYSVTVRRTADGTSEFRIVAPNPALATQRALDDAPNHVFTEHHAEYAVDSVRLAD